jgi:aerotolerance regulator-like protein
MLPLLTAPWALAALAAVPALAALYLLRNTWREIPVSSLMFWLHQAESKASGLRVKRLQTPLLFFLEIAALLLLAFAATGPRMDTAQGRWPLVVVLDDSYSMQAGGMESARRLALEALRHEVRWGEGHPVRFLLASDYPQALGETVGSWAEAEQILEGWRCQAPIARLPEAAALAGELSGDKARILIVSDHAPDADPGEGRVQWWAFGQPRPNAAFVNAARSTRDGLDRCLVELGNFSSKPQTTTLILETLGKQEIHREALALAAQEIRRVTYRLPKEVDVVRARIDADSLTIDNEAILVREETPPVRTLVQLKNEALRVPVEKALTATNKAVPPGELPQLLITDDPDTPTAAAETWLVEFSAEKDAEPYVGPFVLDRTHPLTEGWNLSGVVWGAGRAESVNERATPGRGFPGAPVVMAGNVPLVTDAVDLAGQHHVRVRLRPDLSTLIESPAWPILVWNLVQWRASELPGLRRANLRLGESALLALPLGVNSVLHLPPESPSRQIGVQSQRLTIRPEETGLHEVEAGESKYQFAVNALRREESDLMRCVTGRWGEWTEDAATAPAFIHLAWIPMVVVLAVLTLHMALAFRAGKQVL